MAYSFIGGKRFTVDFVYKCEQSGKPGEVLRADNNGLIVACGEGSVLIKDIKVEGKKKMSVGDYLRGHTIAEGTLLGKD